MERTDEGPGGTPRLPPSRRCPGLALPQITSSTRLGVGESGIFPEQIPVGTKQRGEQIL